MKLKLLLLCSLVLTLGPWQSQSHSQSQQRARKAEQPSASFTQAQAAAGRTAYRESCVSCHLANLEGEGPVPSLVGGSFNSSWRGVPAETLAFHIRRMPPAEIAEPGSISEETYTNIMAYILISNDFEPSDVELPTTMAALIKLGIPQL